MIWATALFSAGILISQDNPVINIAFSEWKPKEERQGIKASGKPSKLGTNCGLPKKTPLLQAGPSSVKP